VDATTGWVGWPPIGAMYVSIDVMEIWNTCTAPLHDQAAPSQGAERGIEDILVSAGSNPRARNDAGGGERMPLYAKKKNAMVDRRILECCQWYARRRSKKEGRMSGGVPG
jgi:hypothetical protein